jgi:hypothetical protein
MGSDAMRLYSVMVLLEACVADDDPIDPLWEEVLFLVRAADPTSAVTEAAGLAREREVTYTNNHGNAVEWKFVEVAEVQELEETEFRDGMEVWSRMFRRPRQAEPAS